MPLKIHKQSNDSEITTKNKKEGKKQVTQIKAKELAPKKKHIRYALLC